MFTLAQKIPKKCFCSHLTPIEICCTRVNTKTRARSDFFASDLRHFQMWILIGYTSDIWTSDLHLNTHIRFSTELPMRGRHVCSYRFLNGVSCRRAVCARILLRWKLFIGKKLHIQELVFNPCPVNFENTTAKSYIIFLSNEVITWQFL